MKMELTGRLIRQRRRRLGIDQRRLAELAGVSEHTVVQIESGRANPTLRVLEAVLDALGMELVLRVRTMPGDGQEMS